MNKKPSKRILELYKQEKQISESALDSMLNAIVFYLDEEWEKKNNTTRNLRIDESTGVLVEDEE